MIDVLIVGGGPTGVALACDLLRRGVSVRVIDRLAGPMQASKGKGLQPRTLEIFDDLGIIGAILDAGRLYPPLAFYENGKIILEHHMMTNREASETVPYPNTWMVPQWKTEELLARRLGELGGHVEYNTEFVTLEQNDASVTATVQGPRGKERIKSRFLVASDGGRSAVRNHLGIKLEGETPKLEGLIVADVLVDKLDRDHWHAWGKGLQESAMLCPLPSTEAFQYMAALDPSENPELSLETLQSYLDKRSGGTAPKLLQQTWMSIFRPNVRMADHYRDGRVFLSGDAAHVHPPTGGQGLNTSVQDSYNLGWKLGAAIRTDDLALLDSYEEERLPVAAAMLGRADLLYRRGLDGDRTAMRRGDDEQQLLLNYRGSSILGESDPSCALHAGDRMPNAWLTSNDGQKKNLFDLMRGPHRSVLSIDGAAASRSAERKRGGVRGLAAAVFGSRQSSQSAASSIEDGVPTRHFTIRTKGSAGKGEFLATGTALHELSGRTVEIRPDGYIAAIHAPTGSKS